MPRKPLDNEGWHVRLPRQASLFYGRMPQVPEDMPLEAHCQEDRGINAVLSLETYPAS